MMQSGAHASKLIVAGTDYRIRRTFDLICRIEEEFGEIGDFVLSCQTKRLSVKTLAKLYETLLKGADNPPTIEVIQDHIAAIGPLFAFKRAAEICSALFIGEELYMARVAEQDAGNASSPQTGAIVDSAGISG
jgi:hypothetical protein